MNAIVRSEIIKGIDKTLDRGFAKAFEKEWKAVTARLKGSRRDLSKIPIVRKDG